MYRTFVLTLIALYLTLSPVAVLAQTPPTNTPATNQVLQRYNPNIQTGIGAGSGGNGFQGVNFSGVGGALASCLNIGQNLISGASSVLGRGLGSIPGIGGSKVPVTDSTTQDQLKKQNNTTYCLNGIAYAVAKNMLQQVTNRTLSWINTGFNGNPFYVRDIDSYLKSVRDEKLASFLQYAPTSDPIFGNAIRSIVTEQVTGYTDGRLGQLMNTPEAQEYSAFQSDFTQGGWNAFLNPKNNAIGAYFNAVDTISSQLNTAQQNVQNELTQGEGFLSMKKCAEWDNSSNNIDISAYPYNIAFLTGESYWCATESYSLQNKNEISACEGQYPAGSGYDDTALLACKKEATTRYKSALAANCKQGTATSGPAPSQPQCTRYETVTPGSVIAQQAAAVTTTNIRQLEQADQINEVLGAFFDQLLNRLFNQGIGGVGGSGSGGGFGPGSNVVLGANGQPLSSVNSGQNVIGYDPTNGGFNGDFDISRPQQLRAIIKTQKDFLNRATDSQIVLNQIAPRVAALDYCLPGPNPSWQEATNDNLNILFATLQPSATAFQIGTTAKDPLLYDKTTGNTQVISTVVFDGTVSRIRNWLSGAFSILVGDYTNLYDPTVLTTKYMDIESTAQNKLFAKGFVRDSVRETTNLINYSLNTTTYNTQYKQSLDDTELAIEELEDINTEILQIVGTAKARYIAAQAAAGTPVDRACIDQAYVLDTTPITGVARQEPDGAIDPFAVQSKAARDYFYSNL